MKVSLISPRAGFTLLELTVVIMMGMIIAALALALFNQQLAFLRIYQTQNFLAEEAPIINTCVSKLVSGADRIRLHGSVNDALNGTDPRATDASAPVMILNFRQPDGSMRASILAFETIGGVEALYYYIVPEAGPLGSPEWFITRTAANVTFSLDQGVIRCSVTGPAREVIHYAVSMQL